jgi:hypothetical protein
VSASIPYLTNYLESFNAATSVASDPKGKHHVLSASTNISAASSEQVRWIAPAIGTLKANVDACWDAATKRVGIGIIIRDHKGLTVLSKSESLAWCSSAKEAEATACMSGLNLLIEQ